MTPDELKSLADTEKQLAIYRLGQTIHITDAQFIVENIINATLLYSAELQSRSLGKK